LKEAVAGGMLARSEQAGREVVMSTLGGRVAWVTGGGSGIGLAGAVELAKAGATVVISGRRAEILATAAEEVRAAGGRVDAVPLDVADAASVEKAAGTIIERHGRVDILVNSAGLNVAKRSWSEISAADWALVNHVNNDGTFYCIAAILPAMRERKDGLIINVSSWAGRHASKLTGPAYNASKHAVVALTHSLNMEEAGNGIRACVICPGEVDTPILDKRPVPVPPETRAKMLKAEDLGRTIRFVAEMPPHVCVNEILISPTWNRTFLGF
jgi:NADP-dependent 3-hydroxy acid dehydrogenase YdfG